LAVTPAAQLRAPSIILSKKSGHEQTFIIKENHGLFGIKTPAYVPEAYIGQCHSSASTGDA